MEVRYLSNQIAGTRSPCRRYSEFDTHRRAAEAVQPDADDLKQIEEWDEQLKRRKQ